MANKITSIKKTTGGKVQFIDSIGNIVASILPNVSISPVGVIGLQIIDTTQVKVVVYALDITSLQIEPDPPIPFSGNTQSLWAELLGGFFLT